MADSASLNLVCRPQILFFPCCQEKPFLVHNSDGPPKPSDFTTLIWPGAINGRALFVFCV